MTAFAGIRVNVASALFAVDTTLNTGSAEENLGQPGFPQERSVPRRSAVLFAAPGAAHGEKKGRRAELVAGITDPLLLSFRKQSAALTYRRSEIHLHALPELPAEDSVVDQCSVRHDNGRRERDCFISLLGDEQ